MKSKKLTYQNIIHQRAIVAVLTLGLIAVLVWTVGEVILTDRETPSIPAARLIDPLNPELDLELVEELEALPLITADDARRELPRAPQIVPTFFSATASATPAPIALPAETSSPSGEPVLPTPTSP